MSNGVIMEKNSKKLLDQVRDSIRTKHYSIRTEKSYIDWTRRFIYFFNKRHPKDMGEREIEAFLSHLAVDKNVASSTQNQALCALVFLYKNVLHIELDSSIDAVRAKQPSRLPTVMTKKEVGNLINALPEEHRLMAGIKKGTGCLYL